ncbi:MAG: NAD(P)-dependent oxidoreductase [Bacteroidia bacterium]
MRIIDNDGIAAAGKSILEAAGFEVITDNIAQADLASRIAEFDALIVRSATKVTAEIMDAGQLKLIARAGVGMDNIDLKHAGSKGIVVVNTPNASSRSVAELVFAHLFSVARYLHESNRNMPQHGKEDFASMKKKASNGFELMGKKIGIVGFGRIGIEVAKMAIGLGMEVLIYDYKEREFEVVVQHHTPYQQHNFQVVLKGQKLESVLAHSDVVTVHTPGSAEVIGSAELAHMKSGSVLINCARGGVVNEPALRSALESGHIAFAGVDVFVQEPPVNDDLLLAPNVSLSAHVGASTPEAQERVGIELAERICQHLKA